MIRTESSASRTTPALFFVPTTMPKRRKLRRKNSQHLGERDRIVKDVDEDEGCVCMLVLNQSFFGGRINDLLEKRLTWFILLQICFPSHLTLLFAHRILSLYR